MWCRDLGTVYKNMTLPTQTEAEDFSSSLCVQTGSGAHPASCTMGTGILSPGVNRGRGVTLTTHPHLVQRLRMSSSYTSSPPRLLQACSGTSLPFYTQISTEQGYIKGKRNASFWNTFLYSYITYSYKLDHQLPFKHKTFTIPFRNEPTELMRLCQACHDPICPMFRDRFSIYTIHKIPEPFKILHFQYIFMSSVGRTSLCWKYRLYFNYQT
jgi:hypothetical protein